MNVGAQLAEAMHRGARLLFPPAPERPIIRCLSPDAKQALAPLLEPAVRPRAQALMDHVAAYRGVLLGLFRLNASASGEDAEDAHRLVADEMRLLDDLGPVLADAVRGQVAAEYVEMTGLCPLCGGVQHG